MGKWSHRTTRQRMDKVGGRGGTIGGIQKGDRQENEIFYDSNGDPFRYRKVRPTETVEEGTSVRMLFDDGEWYKGRVDIYNEVTDQYRIAFDDGDKIYVKLPDDDVQIAVPVWKTKEGKIAKRPKYLLFNSSDPLRSEEILSRLGTLSSVESVASWEEKGPDKSDCVTLVPTKKFELDLEIAPPLVSLLTADWAQVAHELKVHSLPVPSDISVASILARYIAKGSDSKEGGGAEGGARGDMRSGMEGRSAGECEGMESGGKGEDGDSAGGRADARERGGMEEGKAGSRAAGGGVEGGEWTGRGRGKITMKMRQSFAEEVEACFEVVVGDMLLYNTAEHAQHKRLSALLFPKEGKEAMEGGIAVGTVKEACEAGDAIDGGGGGGGGVECGGGEEEGGHAGGTDTRNRKNWSHVYGIHHLLRLMTKLPEACMLLQMKGGARQIAVELANDLSTYLAATAQQVYISTS